MLSGENRQHCVKLCRVVEVRAGTKQPILCRKEKHHSNDLEDKGLDVIVLSVWCIVGSSEGQCLNSGPVLFFLSAIGSMLDFLLLSQDGCCTSRDCIHTPTRRREDGQKNKVSQLSLSSFLRDTKAFPEQAFTYPSPFLSRSWSHL